MWFSLHAGQQCPTMFLVMGPDFLQVAASTAPPSTSFTGSQSVQGPWSSPKYRLNLLRLIVLMWQHCSPLKQLHLSVTTSHAPVLIEEVAHVPAGMTL